MVDPRHVLSQGPMLESLGRTAIDALLQRGRRRPRPSCPGPWIEAQLPPLPLALVEAFVRNAGGSALPAHLPPHLFPQWGLPLAARALRGLPYPLLRVMNAGCTLRHDAPLPLGEPLSVRARLESIDETDTRAILTTRIVTQTARAPAALTAEVHAFVPLGKTSRTSPKKEPPRVPNDAQEIGRARLARGAGLDFALLTGDFNPIHWLGPYARLSGFAGTIFHGFGTFAVAYQALVDHLGGTPREVHARFTKPLRLPAKVGVFVTARDELLVGERIGKDVFLQGRFLPEQGLE